MLKTYKANSIHVQMAVTFIVSIPYSPVNQTCNRKLQGQGRGEYEHCPRSHLARNYKRETADRQWWHTPVISGLRRQKYMNPCEFEANLAFRESFRTAREQECLSLGFHTLSFLPYPP